MKRILSFALALMMMTSVLVLPAFMPQVGAAETATTPTEGMSFKQTDDYQTETTLTAIPHTFEATVWVPKDETFSANSTIIGNYGGNAGAESLNFEVTKEGWFRLFLMDAGGSTTNGNFTCTTKINTGTWTHIAITWIENEDQTSATAYYYVNGECVGEATRGTGNYPTFRMDGDNYTGNSIYANGGVQKPLRLGGDYRSGGANGNYCKVRVQDIAIYDDVRTAAEIAADYQNGANGEGLLAKYDLPDSAEPAWIWDDSGNGQHIKRNHTPAALTSVSEGMSFTTGSDYKTEAPLSALPLTYEATVWFPADMSSSTFGGAIISSYGGSGSEQVNFTVCAGGGLQLTMNDKDGTGSANWQFNSAGLYNGQWTHVAITVSPDHKTGTCYINGVKIGEQTRDEGKYPTFAYNPTKVFGLGRTNSTGENATRYFKGFVKDITLYTDTRTADEIIYDCAKSTDMQDPNLLAKYDLSAGGEPAYIYDESGNEHYIKRNHTPTPAPIENPTEGMTFDSTDQYRTDVPLSTVPHTFEATVWFPAGADYSAASVILGNSGGVGSEIINFEVLANGNPRIYLQDNRKSANLADGNFQCPTVDLRTGEWTHVTITLSEDYSTASYYINGVYISSETRAEGKYPVYANGPEKISCLGGDLRTGNSCYFKGRIKDVTLFSDVRTANEIKKDSIKGVAVDEEGLLAKYSLPDNEKPVVVEDESANTNDFKEYIRYFSDKEPVTDYAYSFAVVGDTQILNRDYPDYYAGIYDWLVENASAKNMKFVFGLGDITDLDSTAEWARAKANLAKLDGLVPYSIVRGNHDSAAKLEATFPYADYADVLGGSYDGTIVNTWRELVVGDIKYLIFTLDYGPSDDVLAWAEDIIEANPTHNVIITTHAYLYRDGTTIDDGDVYPPSATGGYNDGDDMWEKLIKKHENIVMVMSGHDPCDQVVMTQTAGDNGNVVTQFLIDPQGVDATEAAGLVAIMYFSEDGKNVQLEYYSTVKEQYFLRENQFSFELPVVKGDENASGVTSSASITIGTTYSINVYLDPAGAVTAAGAKVGNTLLPGKLQADGTYKVTVATAYAKDLLNTTVTYYPYYTTSAGTVTDSNSVTVHAATLLEAYIAGDYPDKAKTLAQAAFDYAAVAKAYFAGEAVDADVLARLEQVNVTGTDGMVVTAGAQYTFIAATLGIEETINFVFAIGNADGSDLTSLTGVSLTIDGTDVAVSEFINTEINGQKVMAAVITGVPEAKFADSLTFCLADTTLTYSVKDYCVRTLVDAAEAEANMIRAIYAIGTAAEAYSAE